MTCTRLDRTRASLVIALSLIATGSLIAAEPPTTAANVVHEFEFTSTGDHKDPFNEIELDVAFTTPDGREVKVPAFWAGGDTWRVRFASPLVGVHRWRTICSDPLDKGLHDKAGELRVTAYEGDNPLYRNGPIVVAPNRRNFQHLNGEPFLWIGDTQWMSLSKRIAWPDEFNRLLDNRRDKGFNVIQIVAGPYPDQGPFDPRGDNEAGPPWEKDFTRINPAYYDMADRRLMRIVDRGVMPCIVGLWGYHIDWMGEEKIRRHWRYLIARYGALPVAWCIAGEANLPWYLAKGFPYDDREQVAAWTRVARYIRSIEPYGRPISIHPTGLGAMTSLGTIDDASLIDFDMLQTGHGDMGSLAPTVGVMRRRYAADPRMPVLNSEVCYEGILGGCDAKVQRVMFWASMLSGACGHTYGANGIWQINGRERRYGPSPHGGDYGPTPWEDAMNLPGSKQVALGGRLLRELPWTSLAPIDDSVTLTGREFPAIGRWVWSGPGRADVDAPVAKRYFRRVIDLPDGAAPTRMDIRVTCDDRFAVYFNGQRLGGGSDWSRQHTFSVEGAKALAGRNVLAIEGENLPAPVEANPAGLLVDARVHLADGSAVAVGSDDEWRVTDQAGDGWTTIAFDDSGWAAAVIVAERGGGPWGTIASSSVDAGPFAAETRDRSLRLVYFAGEGTVELHKLEPDTGHTLTWVDPTDGTKHEPVSITSDDNGAAVAGAPPIGGSDWLLMIRRSDP